MSWKKKFVRNWGRLGMKCKLEDIVDVTMGQSPKSEYYNTEGKGYTFLQGNRTFGFKYPTFDTYTTVMTKPAKAGDVIMSVRAPVGDLNITPVDMCLGRGVCSLRMKNGNQDFLFYMMKYYIPHLLKKESGTVFGSVNRNDINGLEVNIPEDAQVQKKIARYLEMIDDKIELNNAINNNLLQQALAVYKAWFCDYVLSDGVLPESWHITTIDALSSLVTRGIAPKYDDSSNQIVLNQKCIRDHTIDVSLARRHLQKRINEKWISKGDLLINSTGTGTLGRVAQVWFDTNNMTVDSHVTIVRPKAPILQSYIGFWGFSHESEIEAQHTGSTGQTELPRDRVKALELLLPDEDTLIKFNGLVIPMTDIVVSNQKENARLSQLRDTLLPKLMSGEFDVSTIEI